MLLRRARNSGLGKGGTRDDGGGEEGMEKPMTDEIGSKGLEMEAAPRSQDANVLFRTVGVDVGTSASVGAGVDAVMFGSAHGVTISCCVVPSTG